MQYAQTYRVIRLAGSDEFESDTDHTVMLGIFACALKDYCAPELDRGKLAEYALIHDLVEVYAGDTATLGMIDKSAKEAREHRAFLRLKDEYDAVFPWIGTAIETYEEQMDPEARFIKVLDKIMPGVTHAHNKGRVFNELQVPPEDIKKQKDFQRAWVIGTAKEWPLLIEIYDHIHEEIFKLPYFQK
jgi:putative hydrolase of HD superfamily